MKKKLVSALMCATMAVTMLAGCGNGSKNGTEAADVVVAEYDTVGAAGIHIEARQPGGDDWFHFGIDVNAEFHVVLLLNMYNAPPLLCLQIGCCLDSMQG